MRADGPAGELLHGYAVAASLGEWTLTAVDEDRFQVRAPMRVDEYLIARRPLRLVLSLGTLHWTWDDARIENDRILVEGRPLEGVRVLHGT